MNDLISRQDAIDAIHKEFDEICVWDESGQATANEVENILYEVPSAEPERKTFHVIDKKTGQEADPWEIALNEAWAKHLCYCDMEGFAILEDGSLILADECGRFEFIQEEDRFEIVWDEVTNE